MIVGEVVLERIYVLLVRSFLFKGKGIIVIMLVNGVKYLVERNYINLINIVFIGDKVFNDFKCIYLLFNLISRFFWVFD